MDEKRARPQKRVIDSGLSTALNSRVDDTLARGWKGERRSERFSLSA